MRIYQKGDGRGCTVGMHGRRRRKGGGRDGRTRGREGGRDVMGVEGCVGGTDVACDGRVHGRGRDVVLPYSRGITSHAVVVVLPHSTGIMSSAVAVVFSLSRHTPRHRPKTVS